MQKVVSPSLESYVLGLCLGRLSWPLVIYVKAHFGVHYFIHVTANYFRDCSSISLAAMKDF